MDTFPAALHHVGGFFQGRILGGVAPPALNSTCRQPPKKAVGGFNEEEDAFKPFAATAA